MYRGKQEFASSREPQGGIGLRPQLYTLFIAPNSGHRPTLPSPAIYYSNLRAYKPLFYYLILRCGIIYIIIITHKEKSRSKQPTNYCLLL